MRFETTVKNIISRAYDVKSFRFPRPTDFTYEAGQFMKVTIRSGDNELGKYFSFSSSPTERDFIEFTKKLTGYEYSNILDEMKVGGWAKIDGPYGSFTFRGEYDKVCLLSGGVGITPLRSICKYCTDMKLDVNIILIYANRTEKNIIFREDLELMQKQNENLKIVLTLDEPGEGWNGETGMINADKIKKNVMDYATRVFYTCGPPGMIQATITLLKSLNIAEEQIKIENFAGY
jgi:ferredoxin-NADP reductase